MWPFLTALLLAGIVALHFWWKRRYERVQKEQLEQQRASEALRLQHEQGVADLAELLAIGADPVEHASTSGALDSPR